MATPPVTSKEKKPRLKLNRYSILTITSIAIIVLAAAGIGGMALLHQSDTNPNFCGTCHIMQPNVTSYLTSGNLDSVHQQAGVQCKECHDYPVQAEVASGINFVMGNYEVTADGSLTKREYGDEMCLQCHISREHVALKTATLARDPHTNHLGELPCRTCHVSHGEQIDYCSSCHDNGGQRMIGSDTETAQQ